MAIDLLNLGTVADDRTGDTFRAGGTKINAMFTELYAFKDSESFVFVSQESEFPVQDATTITLESQKLYVTTAAISTAKRFVVQDAAVLTSFNVLGPVLEYTGTGSMFTGSDVSFIIKDIQISHPNSQGFNFTDTIGNIYLYVNESVRTVSGSKYGTFNNMQTVSISGSSSLDMDDGVTFTGANQSVVSFSQFFMQSTSASFIGADLGTSIALTWEFTDLILVGPAGSIGIKGAASSANVTAGAEATVTGGNFANVTTPLSGITVDDIRWEFSDNAGISDSLEDGLLSFNGSVTETTITTINTPVIVNATWAVIRSSKFTGTTGGRLTYNGQRAITVPIDVAIGVISVGGVSIDVSIYLAKNGSVITASKTTVAISGSTQRTLSIPWQDSISTNDYYEIYVENNSGTTNVIVETGRLRIR